MPIKLTNRQLANALNSGAYARFAALRKSIAAGHRNRKVPAAINEELTHLIAVQEGLMKQFGGVLVGNEVKYPDDKAAEANAAHAQWMEQFVELPGEPIRLSDLLDGGLLESDYAVLEPFLTE